MGIRPSYLHSGNFWTDNKYNIFMLNQPQVGFILEPPFGILVTCLHQSIKSSFVKGVHPQNAPCRRRSHALKSAPIRRGKLLSTVLHRWSPLHYPECRPQINHIFSNLASRTHPKSSLAVQDLSSQGLAWTSLLYCFETGLPLWKGLYGGHCWLLGRLMTWSHWPGVLDT